MNQNPNQDWYFTSSIKSKATSANDIIAFNKSEDATFLTNEFIDNAKIYTSITDITVEDKRLIISFANGLVFDCGKVHGDKLIVRKTPKGIEYRYETEPDEMFKILVPIEDILFKFEDLTPEQRDQLAFHFSDFTEDEIKLLQQPATEAGEEVKRLTQEQVLILQETNKNVTEAEQNRVKAESNREINENNRKREESDRINNENTRINNDTTRQINEQTRKTNEENRIVAETKREKDTVAAIKAVNEAKNATEAAITNAYTQANRAKGYADNPPKIVERQWWVYDEATKAYKNTGVYAIGEAGKSPIIKDNHWWVYDNAVDDYVDTGISLSRSVVLEECYLNEGSSNDEILEYFNSIGETFDSLRIAVLEKHPVLYKSPREANRETLAARIIFPEDNEDLYPVRVAFPGETINSDNAIMLCMGTIINLSNEEGSFIRHSSDSILIFKKADGTFGAFSDYPNTLYDSPTNNTVNKFLSEKIDKSVASSVITNVVGITKEADNVQLILTATDTTSGVTSNMESRIVAADTTYAGVMTSAQVKKLNTIAEGAQVNVKSDWNATSGDAQILNKPTLNTFGGIPKSEKGIANGVATLDTEGKVPSSQLPSYVDDVLEYPNRAGFPATGESGKVYIAADTNITYRWSGSSYVVIGSDLALGETSSTAYPGNKGKKNADDIAAINTKFNNYSTTAQNDAKYLKLIGGTMSDRIHFKSDKDNGTARFIDFYGLESNEYKGSMGIDDTKLVLSNSISGKQFQLLNTGELKYDNQKVWYAGNDGPGSGLDADTVDGIHASSFCRYNSDINADDYPINEVGYGNISKGWKVGGGPALSIGAVSDDKKYGLQIQSDRLGKIYTRDINASVASDWREFAFLDSNGKVAKAVTADTLSTPRTINGTSFNGSANITTTNWGTARNIQIANSDGTSASTAVSVNGSANVVLKLPATIKASLAGNASTATQLMKRIYLWGQSFDGTSNINGSLTGVTDIVISGSSASWNNGIAACNISILKDNLQTPLLLAYRAGTSDYAGANRLFTMELLNTGNVLKFNFLGESKYTFNSNGSLVVEGNITATSFVGNLSGNATSATTANTANAVTWNNVTGKPTWIGSSKPTYTAAEVGALASNGTAVNASKVANSFVLKIAGGTTENTNQYTFNGSIAKTLNITAGSNITLSPTSGGLAIAAKDTTYTAATTSANGLMTAAMVTKLNGIATGANNYTLPAATSTVLGGVKTGTGITNSSGTISVTYGTAAGTTCQGNDARLSNSRPANGGTSAACSGNAATATKLATARIISLIGDVTGSVTFDGSSNISIDSTTNLIDGVYTGNGGVQPPSYVPSRKARINMMNLNTSSDSNYKDWLLMDSYSGSDVPYVTAIGVSKVALPELFIMSGPKGNTSASSWVSRRVASYDPGNNNLATTGTMLAAGGFFKQSDKRLKSDIKPLEHALNDILSIPTTSFVMNNNNQIGTIAQDIEHLFPEIVKTRLEKLSDVPERDDWEIEIREEAGKQVEYVKIKQVEYEMLAVLALEGLKLLNKKVDNLIDAFKK